MFETYASFTDWITSWPTGRQVSSTLSYIVDPEDVTGFIMKDTEIDDNLSEIKIFVITEKLFIQGLYSLDRRQPENETFTVKTYKLADIRSTEISLSDPVNLQFKPNFKNQSFTFHFSNQEPVTFNALTRFSGNFDEFISKLMISK